MHAELRRLEKERRTGVLHAGDEGAFHVADGAVAFARSRRATGLDRLVVESGAVSAEDWGRIRLGEHGDLRADRQPWGTVPIRRSQLETFALLALFDAAFFLLESASAPVFEEGPAHWLAPVCRVTPATLAHECERRRDGAATPWPSSLADRAPVVPVTRIRRQRVILTGLEAELLVNADGRRSPAELAMDLGRTTYGCLLAVRSLVAAGLVQPPAVQPPVPDAPDAPAAVPAVPGAALGGRRAAGTAPERPAGTDSWWTPPDLDVLVRLRAALEELA
ncbi:hypothetical protein [Actinomadura parmotrematis]|uniref:MarR family transcriptional regulator n=1 Tax=Actinomadura parmotrematis TaxID=2864039 RepID=A0ABS7FQA3_9ACTN|nr:hypothetical protein [Actinomadura parmotrematis]MBW8482583.1 hypothetical protein [Actinomadura parmotrematis]